ncbi:MAG: ABC transporter permease [Chloroflexi bacterium]|nr:ABC transporter permease [Chloroflexota bacterium]
MVPFVVGRLLALGPLLLAVSIIAFLVLYLSPGDPARLMLGENVTPEGVAQLRRELGLDQPVHVQYGMFLLNATRGDLGRSYSTAQPVTVELARRFVGTLRLSGLAFGLAVLIGIPIGVLTAVSRNSWLDHVVRVLVLAFVSIPVFWLGILLMYLFAVSLRWLPSSGDATPVHVILPAVALSTFYLGVLVRMVRAAMLEVLQEDYLRTAYAKGLMARTVVIRHALKNAMIPVVTIIGLQIGSLMTGSVLTETVFAWPGVGKYMIDAVFTRDYPVIRACILLFAVSFAGVNIVVDALYSYLNPQIRFATHR